VCSSSPCLPPHVLYFFIFVFEARCRRAVIKLPLQRMGRAIGEERSWAITRKTSLHVFANKLLRRNHKHATYLFDFRRINIYFLFCRTNSVRGLIFV
jgi:hypothetical protein